MSLWCLIGPCGLEPACRLIIHQRWSRKLNPLVQAVGVRQASVQRTGMSVFLGAWPRARRRGNPKEKRVLSGKRCWKWPRDGSTSRGVSSACTSTGSNPGPAGRRSLAPRSLEACLNRSCLNLITGEVEKKLLKESDLSAASAGKLSCLGADCLLFFLLDFSTL